MKAGLGLSIAAGVAALTAVSAAAQTTGAPAAPAPAQQQQQQPPAPSDTVGPRELRDFSLGGTPAQPAPSQEAPPAAETPADNPPATATRRRDIAPSPRARPDAVPSPSPAIQAPAGQVSSAEPALPAEPDIAPTVTPFETAPVSDPAPSPPAPDTAGSNPFPIWPWLLAGLAVALGAGLMFFRQRSRRELAGYGFDEPSPAPQPSPAPPSPSPRSAPTPQPVPPPRPAPLSNGGIVSTGLRPWVELQFTPGRCIFDQTQATFEFLVKVTNGGNANARDLRIDTKLFNAGPTQDDEIQAFFAHPNGHGDALDTLPPLRALEQSGSVSLPLDRLQILDAGGRRLFVPLIGFNLLYRWSGGQGQTSLGFLLGREGGGEKMAPFRADLGPRIFRSVGARELEIKVRR